MKTTQCLAFGILCVLATGLNAQTDQARLAGVVADSSGATVAGATVTLRNEKTGAIRSAVTSDKGQYLLVNLQPSDYTASAKASGLSSREYSHIPLEVGQERTLNITVQVESLAQTVEVSGGDLAVIDTSSAKVGVNVSEREVASLPLNGRQLSQLYLLAPGAQTAGGGSFDNIRFSGRANQQNAVRFDGIEGSSVIDASPGNLNGETSSGFRLQASLETIQEFRVESSNYPAEFGTGTGGQISVVTKSGANAVHGSLFEYLRNSAIDARNFFDGAKKTPLRLNQYGGSLGGAIIKDKLF